MDSGVATAFVGVVDDTMGCVIDAGVEIGVVWAGAWSVDALVTSSFSSASSSGVKSDP